MVVVGHPERHHLYEVAHAYLEAGQLQSFVTTRFVGSPLALQALRLLSPGSTLVRRALASHHAAIFPHVLASCPNPWTRVLLRLGGTKTTRKEWIDAVVDEADRANAVHLPCVFAMEVFERLKGSGKRLILEQYVGDRRLGRVAIERESKQLGVSTVAKGYEQELIERNEREYQLADVIVAGSRFVATSLAQAGVPPNKVVVAEYGCDPRAWPYSSHERSSLEPLNVALVGSDIVRKGTLRTLMAARIAKGVRVHVFGTVVGLPGGTGAWGDVAVFHGHVPRADLVAHLKHCHVFCLPSVWEGSSYAIGEAMASGLPAIVTANAGSWVRDGRDGVVVPVGDVEAIAAAMDRLKDDGLRGTMATQARSNAEAHTWAHYRETLRQACLPILAEAV
jgi:glycosyltransferase involved in cell wall biosynthesis